MVIRGRISLSVWCVVAFVMAGGVAGRAALAADPIPVSDFDRRVAATLIECYSGEPKTPETLPADLVRTTLTRFEKTPDGKLTYVMNFGGISLDGVDSRGYLRITKGEELADPVKGGWTVLKVDPGTGAEILFKRVEKTEADKYLNVAVRKKVGNVILTVAQRRQFHETNDGAGLKVHERFRQLLDVARKNKVLGGKVRMTLVDESGQPDLAAADPQLFSLRDTEREMRVQLQFEDPDGKIVEPKKVKVELQGVLAQRARLKYRDQVISAGKKHVIDEPGLTLDLVLVLPSSKDADASDTLLAAAATSPDEPAVKLKVGASLK
jgi:hypothetical protein